MAQTRLLCAPAEKLGRPKLNKVLYRNNS